MYLVATSARGTVDFYVAASALIVVLLLAYLFQVQALRKPTTTSQKTVRLIYSLTNLVVCLGGEVCALIGAYNNAEVAGIVTVWVWAGAISLSLHLGYFLVRRIVWFK
jgi:hypothetical protein